MTDHESNMIEERHRTGILLSEIPGHDTLSEEHQISSIESQAIDKVFECTSQQANGNISNLDQLLLDQNQDALFMASMGATMPCTKECLLDCTDMPALIPRHHDHDSDDDEDDDSDTDSEDSEENSQGSDSESLAFQFETKQEVTDFMTSATTTGRSTGVTPEHSSKV